MRPPAIGKTFGLPLCFKTSTSLCFGRKLEKSDHFRSSTTAASSASSASKEPNNNEETLPNDDDDATATVESHLHHRVGSTVNSHSSDSDLGSTDEVKVFNDEDEPDAGDLVSESCYQAELQAEKSSLIHESEQVSTYSFKHQSTTLYLNNFKRHIRIESTL